MIGLISPNLSGRSEASSALDKMTSPATASTTATSAATGTPVDSSEGAAASSITTPSTEGTDLGCLQGATLEDVEVGAEAIYLVDKRNAEYKTKLKSIDGKPIKEIGAKVLRNWAVSIHIQMKKGFKKHEIVQCILTTKAYRERVFGNASNGATTTTDGNDGRLSNPATINAPRNHINNVRFINCLANDQVVAKLIQRGAQKTRRQLDNGEDPDAILYEMIVEKYNDESNDEASSLKWDITWTRQPDPSRFHPINTEKAIATYKDLSSSYEKAHSNWKKSGHHGGIPTKDFHSFVGSSNYLDYLHCLVQSSPGLLSTFKADLPPGVFSEGSPVNNLQQRPAKQSKKDDAMENIADAQQQKARCMAFQTHSETYANLEVAVTQQKQRFRTILRKLKDEPPFDDKDTAYLKRYIAKIGKKRVEKDDGDNGGDSDSEIDFQQATQQSEATGDSFDDHRMLVDEYLDLEVSIAAKKKEIKTLKLAMEHYMEMLNADLDNEDE